MSTGPLIRLQLIVASCLLLGMAGGCASDTGRLRMVGLDHQHDFSQHFSQAYISRNATGDADIVLIQDGADVRDDDPRKPITPDSLMLPRQLVHIRVFWTPEAGTKADH